MSTRKILLIIAGVLGALVLLVAIFVGAITWFVFHTIGSSEAAETARTYLRQNEKLKADIGEVKDFGSIVTGNINVNNGNGEATLHLKVIGERRTINADVGLAYRSNRNWRVVEASYDNGNETVDLMGAYGPSPPN
jgi:hypothetical protein